MSNTTSNQVLHPVNPVLVKDVNVPRENGQTRVLPDGSLLYREPLTNTEVPAVRLEDIRPRLVREASKKMSYRFPKKRGYDDTNVTAFVKKDYNYGPKRENRPDRLFQISSDGSRGEKPDGYVMDGDRIVLDAFDHGLRNFGYQLPMYVSSELEGHDIEDYLRRNREISVYDLAARAPNGYWKGESETGKKKKNKKNEKAREWHEGPPRVGTFSMRATRFRIRAGCLSWERKDGTAAKNQRILDVIPAQYKDPAVNSTKGWRDLNNAEIKKIKDGAMRKPQQGPKAKRAAQAGKEQADKDFHINNSIEGEEFVNDEEEIVYEDRGASIGSSNAQDTGVWPEYNPGDFGISMPAPQMYHTNPQSSKAWQIPSVVDQSPLNIQGESTRLDFMQSRKRFRRSPDADSEDGNFRAQKRIRVTAHAQELGSEGVIFHAATSRLARQQQRGPTSSPYTAGRTLAPSTNPATGSNVLGHGSPLNRHQFGRSPTNTAVNPPTQIQSENVGGDAPEWGLQTHGPSEYGYPGFEAHGPSIPTYRVPRHEAQPYQSSGQTPKTIRKRKRPDGSTAEKSEGQRPIKRTKGHTLKSAATPELQDHDQISV